MFAKAGLSDSEIQPAIDKGILVTDPVVQAAAPDQPDYAEAQAPRGALVAVDGGERVSPGACWQESRC